MPTTFANTLITWYANNGRDLPWRHTSDPYPIWLSEIILQQTRVNQGMDYYHRFLNRFPTVNDLAQASEDEVLRLWQGLGYYSRARNLHAAAKQIVENGGFPTTYEKIRKLKGVGDYTAAAIASFAFGLPHAAVDGNAYRVLSRYFDIDLPIDSTQGKRQFQELSQSLLPPKKAAIFNQAMMDLGATCCTPLSPRCQECPLAEGCLSLAHGVIHNRPVKQKRISIRTRHFAFILVTTPTHLLLQQRQGKDIWQGLYQPPAIEFETAPEGNEILHINWVAHYLTHPGATLQPLTKGMTHQLTHQLIIADAYHISLPEVLEVPKDYLLVPFDKLTNYAFPKLILRILEELKA